MEQKNSNTESASTVCYETMATHVRCCVQSWLQDLLEAEVTEFLDREKSQHRKSLEHAVAGYRDGYCTPKQVVVMEGLIMVRRPRLRNLTARFESQILPPYRRRPNVLARMLPQLYLAWIASGDFKMALGGLLEEGTGLSAATLLRLRDSWASQCDAWRHTDLSALALTHWWADGLSVEVGPKNRKAGLLVIVGAIEGGERVLVACQAGERESKQSWLAVLRDLKARGLTFSHLMFADKRVGIGAALGEIQPADDERHWQNREIVNVRHGRPLLPFPRQMARIQAGDN